MRKGMIALAAMAFMVISTSASALTVVDLIGDKDGFGIGAVDGSSFDWEAVGLTGDGDGTDAWMWGDYELTHTYDLTGFGSITYAELEIFTGIAILCTIIGLLVIALLKPLKRLTHGAEEVKEGSHHEEQEPFELADDKEL
jgi:hypothetical protein